jgi:secreted trypsin-like serine protease
MVSAMICLRLILSVFLVLSAAKAYALGGSASGKAEASMATHVVMVLNRRGNACSGTVIARDVVITAAHCVLCRGQQRCVQPTDKLAIAYIEGGSPILQRVRSVVVHPRSSSDMRRSIDVAMIRLAEPLPGRFRPVAIIAPNTPYSEGSDLYLSGYGLQRDKDPKSAGTLRGAGALILSPQTRRIIRVGRTDGPETLRICKGDSGGPVFTGDGRLAAVTFGTEIDRKGSECGSVGQAIKLAPIRDWVDTNLRRWQ